MVRTTVFLSNRSQAVRLPKGVAFPPDVKEVAAAGWQAPRDCAGGPEPPGRCGKQKKASSSFFAKKNQKTLVYKALALQRRAR